MNEALDSILLKEAEFSPVIDNIMVMGGEPLDQEREALEGLLMALNTTGKAIWLFTRYELEDLPDRIISMCNYIKTGRYEEHLKVDGYEQAGITLASANQQIWEIGDV